MKKLFLVALIFAFAVNGAFAAKTTFSTVPVITDSSSTPDAYGYTWVDNDNGGSPDYNWIDISGNGVEVEGLADDNVVGPFDSDV